MAAGGVFALVALVALACVASCEAVAKKAGPKITEKVPQCERSLR